MKITQAAVVIATTGSTAVDAISLRGLFNKQLQQQHTDTAIVHIHKDRELQGTNCPSPAAWHPNYSAGWTNGHCIFKVDCWADGYASELECCNGAYSSQESESCLKSLPDPPTVSPTESGNLDVYYPDYETDWSEGACINTRPLPSGRPNYSTLSECCATAYRGQVSNACIKTLPDYESPAPTVSPTTDVLNGDDYGGAWYPDYSKVWTEGECTDDPPTHRPGDRRHYATELECCEGAYGGQSSGVCLKDVPDQPTSAPTTEEYDMWYPDYDTAWSVAGCSNVRPLPFTVGSRPVYDNQLECCAMSYGGQTSNACVNGLPQPPTGSPTESGGLDVYYPDYDGGDWATGTCVNTRPLPSGRVTYGSQLLCCEGAYAGQNSEACLQDIPGYAPPTSAPSVDVLPEATYYVETWGWPSSTCSNARPLPHEGTPLFDTKEECCEQSSSTEGTSGCMSNSKSKVKTNIPTAPPSKTPSSSPTVGPSTSPTKEPTSSPSQSPLNPTEVPTGSPTMEPSSSPTVGPSASPTKEPTSSPSQSPLNPTEVPTSSPTAEPSKSPSLSPSSSPTGSPSSSPTMEPTKAPSPSQCQLPSTVGIYSQADLNGSGCDGETENLNLITTNLLDNDSAFSGYNTPVDTGITSFADPLLETKLSTLTHFVMPDIESSLIGWNAASQTIVKNYVSNGGILVKTGAGDDDTQFVNDIFFSWDLVRVSCSSSTLDATNSVGTPWEGLTSTTLDCPSASAHANCGTVPDCTPIWGTSSSAAVAVIPYGSGAVIYLAFDYFDSGPSCTQASNPWVTEVYRGSLLYSSSVVFDESFVQGQTASVAAKTAWDCFLASLTGTYTQVTISGSLDSTGVTCSDPVAVIQLANALNTNVAVSVPCNSRTWNVGDCAGPELSADGVCDCKSDYAVRPKYPGAEWGGAGGTGSCSDQTGSLSAPSQSLRVEFS